MKLGASRRVIEAVKAEMLRDLGQAGCERERSLAWSLFESSILERLTA